jgi:hypothetical protein
VSAHVEVREPRSGPRDDHDGRPVAPNGEQHGTVAEVTVGLVLQLLAASLLVALGAIFAAVGAFEEGLIALALGGWWVVRCCRRL